MKSSFELAIDRHIQQVIESQDIIPPITDPMGKGWKQPDTSLIEIGEKTATMTQAVWDQLLAYDRSYPSGVYPGKIWKRTYQDGTQCLLWYSYSSSPNVCSIQSRDAVILPVST